MYLLDTDVLIWILRGRKEIVERVSGLAVLSEISISVITIAEIYQNIFPSELTTTEEHLKDYIIFSTDQKIAKMAGLYWQEYSKRAKKISLNDCLIAATVNVNNLILVTLNRKHFPMKDIQVLKP